MTSFNSNSKVSNESELTESSGASDPDGRAAGANEYLEPPRENGFSTAFDERYSHGGDSRLSP